MIPFLENKKLWGFPYRKIKKHTFSFHIFDRYEIHIQAFVDFINGKLIIFQSSSPQNIFKKYILKIFSKNNIQKTNNAQLQARKSRNHGILSLGLLK